MPSPSPPPTSPPPSSFRGARSASPWARTRPYSRPPRRSTPWGCWSAIACCWGTEWTA
uniref:Uncharacterized protein n=1 Tax=Arundo donax TaxID=35708 RepID=A0A0A9CD68_ARUDO